MGTRKKSIIMFVLAIVLVVMGVTYAAVSTVISINGTANLEATWDVSIIGISEGTPTGEAYNKETPSYVGTRANFNVGFKALGDKMDYEITIKNNGTINAVIRDVKSMGHAMTCVESGPGATTCTEDRDLTLKYLSYVTTGVKVGDIIESGESKVIHFIVDYPEYFEVPTKQISISYEFYVTTEQYTNQEYVQEYKVNDRVMLEDENMWRVLKPAKSSDTNIMLIKEEAISDELVFDENEGHDFNTSTLKTYLNTTYKNTLPDSMKSKIVGDIVIPTAGNFNYEDECEGGINLNPTCVLAKLSYTPINDSGYIIDLLNKVYEDSYISPVYNNSNSNNISWIGKIHYDAPTSTRSIYLKDFMYMLNIGTINVTNEPTKYLNPFASLFLNYKNNVYQNFNIGFECKNLAGNKSLCDPISDVLLKSVKTYPVITINKNAIK